MKYCIKIIVLLFAVAVFKGCELEKEKVQEQKTPGKDILVIEKVIDGDTFKLSNGEKVRLLGIDTPEKFQSNKLESDSKKSGKDKKTLQKLGKLASDYVKGFAEGKKVYLEKEPNHEDRDRYGRLLRYIYFEDGTMVNKKIIADGYAYVYDKFPLSKLDEFRQAYREARENRRGLWGEVKGLENF